MESVVLRASYKNAVLTLLLAVTGATSAVAAGDLSRPVQAGPTPGHMIESTPLAPALGLPGQGAAYHILYTSTDGVTGRGTVTVSGAVYYPSGRPPAGGWPVVAWAHGTVGNADRCAPSVNVHTPRDTAYLSAWLKRGFAIVATDYEGLGTPGPHPYLNTRVEAFGVLDSVRAALGSLPNLTDRVMIVGQSQGGAAAFASAGYAPLYAPEINIRGTVATGVPYMSPAVMQTLPAVAMASTFRPDPLATYLLLMAAGEAGIDPHFRPEDVFTPQAMPFYRMVDTTCVFQLEDAVNRAGLTTAAILRSQAVRLLAPVFQAMMYPTLKLSRPVFVGTGSEDRDVATSGQLLLVHDACAAGSKVEAHLYKGQDHSRTVLASLPDSAIFTQKVMTDQPVSSICSPAPQ
ncbi:alpha/beta hydrolase [Komagataeibacter oboediens]|nr:alpha/beta hydrolase [Komagataeibacter oboediens]